MSNVSETSPLLAQHNPAASTRHLTVNEGEPYPDHPTTVSLLICPDTAPIEMGAHPRTHRASYAGSLVPLI